jgi:hypothetical protein
MLWERWHTLGPRRNLSFSASFSDDTLEYFTERLDPGPTRHALLYVVRRTKRNKGFDDCRWIGLATDASGAGWRTQPSCPLCRPQRNADQEILGYRHSLVLLRVVETGLSCPAMWEPYGPGDSEYAAGQRLLRRVIDGLGKRFAHYVVVDGKFATASFLHTASDLGLAVARLKDNQPEVCTPLRAWVLLGCSTWPRAVGKSGTKVLMKLRVDEHMCHHQANSLWITWLLITLALTIERLYRLRYLHRGTHNPRSSSSLAH